LYGTIPEYVFVAFQLMFAIITVALISGAIADRAKFGAWAVFIVIWMTVVYFPVAHWVFDFGDTGGWIATKLKAFDFAGGTAVHINAGIAGLALAIVLGKRIGWRKDPMRPHNLTLVMLGAKIPSGVAVVKDYAADLPLVPAYAAELNQVWTNLIANALDAMAGQGTLTVRTAKDGDCALVEIGDTGPGIPEELRRRVFEPFFTTKPVGQGTGLGLDVSWRIVTNRHGGDLRVVSRPGDTRFQVRLPLTEPAQVP